MSSSSGRPLTGRKVLIITVAAFSVIVAVNLTMATLAVGGFPGLVSKSPFTEGQRFDAELKAERALGWGFSSDWKAGLLEIRIVDADGAPLPGLTVEALVGRPSSLQHDETVALRAADEPGLYIAPISLEPGGWRVEITAKRDDGAVYIIADEIYLSPSDAAAQAAGGGAGAP